MKRIASFSFGLALAALTCAPAIAQQRGSVPQLGVHAINPGMSLSAPATTPLQSQIQNNYAAQLQGEQRELLQQNPSGLTRPEMAIGRQLNGFTPN